MVPVAYLDVIEDDEWAGGCLVRDIRATSEGDRLPVDGRNGPVVCNFRKLISSRHKGVFADRVADERCTLSSPLLHSVRPPLSGSA